MVIKASFWTFSFLYFIFFWKKSEKKINYNQIWCGKSVKFFLLMFFLSIMPSFSWLVLFLLFDILIVENSPICLQSSQFVPLCDHFMPIYLHVASLTGFIPIGLSIALVMDITIEMLSFLKIWYWPQVVFLIMSPFFYYLFVSHITSTPCRLILNQLMPKQTKIFKTWYK